MSAAVRRRKISILQQFLMSSEPLAQQTPRTKSLSSRARETEDGRARDNTPSDENPQAPVPVPSNAMEQAERAGGQPVSLGVKRDARTAELPDEDDKGGKF